MKTLSKVDQKHLTKWLYETQPYSNDLIKLWFGFSRATLKKAAKGKLIGQKTWFFLHETLQEFKEIAVGQLCPI